MAQPAGIEEEGDPDDWGPCTSTAEWKLRYLNGVTIEQIARFCRVPMRRVRQNIRLFENRHPELAATRLVLNDRPARPTAADLLRKPPRPSWETRVNEAEKFVLHHQRMPRILSKDPAEKALAGCFAGQRRSARSWWSSKLATGRPLRSADRFWPRIEQASLSDAPNFSCAMRTARRRGPGLRIFPAPPH
ncbi:hypothetical protein H4V95_001254 [Arthrobacter sp. CAN_C5]|nr:hypothetical protein [Arthrobacter sp. CAN_C5]